MGIQELILIRHAESKANAAGIYQGISYDTPLTEKGISQARLTAEALSSVKEVAAIYTSPLLRAYQTAEIINANLKVPLVTDRRILEINHGSWEGKKADQFSETELGILKQWRQEPDRTQMPEGEHFEDLVYRVEEFLGDLDQAKGKIIMVTHDAVKRVIVCKWRGLPYDQLWSVSLDNCGITTLGLNPIEVVDLNNTMHLDGTRSDINRQAL